MKCAYSFKAFSKKHSIIRDTIYITGIIIIVGPDISKRA